MNHPILTHPIAQRSTQDGVGLLEVLIAVLVLSVGLLGLAGLQVFTLKSNHNSYLRTQAVNMAYEYLDRIRAARLSAVNDGVSTATVTLWESEVAATLPGGALDVTSGGGIWTVSVTWNDDRDQADVDDQKLSFSVSSRI